jgi:hypothetical protein
MRSDVGDPNPACYAVLSYLMPSAYRIEFLERQSREKIIPGCYDKLRATITGLTGAFVDRRIIKLAQ